MVADYDFEGFTDSFSRFHKELSKYFNTEEIEKIFTEDAHIIYFSRLVAFLEEELSMELLFFAIKSIYYALRIIKDNFKDDPGHKKYLDAISKVWKI